MSEVVLLTGLGLVLLVLMAVLLYRFKSSGAAQESMPKPGVPLSVEIPQELVERLFGSDDWNFVRAQGSEQLSRLFLRERRELALSWMRGVRERASGLMHSHRMAARASSDLKPLDEMRITVYYLLFELLCQSLVLAVWLRGPVALTGLIERIDGLSGQLARVAGRAEPVVVDGGLNQT
jgi:hypothetical protein